MKTKLNLLAAAVFLAAAGSVGATVRYVDGNSAYATPPYTNWATAAATIQDAVDAALPGDEIVVTNGTYATGGRAVVGTMTNRVAVDKPLTVRSVNGPQVTVIRGYQVPGTTNGDGAVRCVYLTNGASLSGFTLTNGATRQMGDHFREQFGGGLWCESTSAIVSNCVLAGNVAYQEGGGAYRGTLNGCKLSGNLAEDGGGAAESMLNNCRLSGNSASYGGGVYKGNLNNCAITGNSADWHGGGAYGATLNNCTLTGNSAKSVGGGAYWSTLNNCIVYFNTAPCGANYYQPSDGIYASVLNYCCTTPQPPGGVGNISLDPQLANAWCVSPASPCRGDGNAAYATGQDLDGEPWGNPPAIGCDEFYSGAVFGDMNVGILAIYTNVAVNYPLELTALIDGRVSASGWDFGDGAVSSNRPYTSHLWTTPGDYAVILMAYNDSHPDGVSATQTVHVGSGVCYVAASSTNPVAPYLSWATAARTIQDGVDGASLGALVLVTNGTYATGGRAVNGVLTNRVAVDKPLTVRSVNGPAVTVIQGYQLPGATNGDGAVRCAYLANGTALIGFTLANGATRSWSLDPSREASGGGLWCESGSAVASNCVITGNAACYGGAGANGGTLSRCTLRGNSIVNQGGGWGPLDPPGYGGGARAASLDGCILTGNSALVGAGADRCGLVNCLLTANVAVNHGGGAWASSLINCTVTGNSAINYGGGGASECNVYNCIVYYNNGPSNVNYVSCFMGYSCTTPDPGTSFGLGHNITSVPRFVNQAGGNLRLQASSPCINAGINGYPNASAPGSTDLDGNPRIVRGTVDIGAYEFQGPGSVISYAWLQQYGLPTDGSADYADADGDGMNNWQEWRCGTDPRNAASVLRLLSASPAGSNVTVTWQSVAGVSYFLERSTDLAATPPFSLLATNLPGQAGTTSFTDTNAAVLRHFYRVGVP